MRMKIEISVHNKMDKMVNKRVQNKCWPTLFIRLSKNKRKTFRVYSEMEMEISKFDLASGGNVT